MSGKGGRGAVDPSWTPAPAPAADPARASVGVAVAAANLADGQWHHLHAATPLLRGGIAFIAVIGIVVANLRERLIGLFIGTPGGDGGDPIDSIYSHGLTGWALLALVVVLVVCVGLFYLSWRMSTFRIGDDAVEARNGILFRTQRKARLDRIQAINIARPLLARVFGASKLEISVAGHDANVHLAYLGSKVADALRREILILASGARTAPAAASAVAPAAASGTALAADGAGPFGNSGTAGRAGPETADSGTQTASVPEFPKETGAAGASTAEVAAAGVPALAATADARRSTRIADLVSGRVDEFFAPELDPDAAPPASVVRIRPGRLLGSLVLTEFTFVMLLVVIGIIVGASLGHPWVLVAVLPGLISAAGFYSNRFTKSLRYSIAGTPDGVRVGFGLLATSSETLPPGRIHAVEISQPLFWRITGWWRIRIDTPGRSKSKGAAGQDNTTILPVGDLTDTKRVLSLVLPDFAGESQQALIEEGMAPRSDRYITAPAQAAWLRPVSWRRTGYTILGGALVLRQGVVWRRVTVVPLARLQSVAVRQGPVRRVLGLASAHAHTVAGPVKPGLAVIGRDAALTMFADVASGAIDWAGRDTSQRWGEERPFPEDQP